MPRSRGGQPAAEPRNKTPVDAVTNSDSPAATSVANRYGTPKRALSKKAKILWLSALVIVGLAWILWATLGGNTGVDQRLISYQVADPTMTTVDVAITKDPGATAQCAIQALNSSFAVVGWNILTVGPNGTGAGDDNGRTTTVRGEVRTDSLAVTGVVDSCWIVPGT